MSSPASRGLRGPPWDGPPQDGDAPRQIGRYEVVESIGSGGMAAVYRAWARGPTGAGRAVAVKLIHRHLVGSPQFVEMFFEEVRVALALTHRNIVQTFDAGEIAGRPYLVMELLEGCSLMELCARTQKAVPLELALFIGCEICAALSYAHGYRPQRAGQPGAVVHRDVSPSNVLLSWAGDVKLADFGVARAADVVRAGESAIKGKLSYMPPEQARGEAEPRSDLFALGVVLYELIGGKQLARPLTIDQALEPRPYVEPLTHLRSGVSKTLDALIRRCLSGEVSERPASADELADLFWAELDQLEDARGDLRAQLARFVKALPPEPPNEAAGRVAAALMAEIAELSVVGGKSAFVVSATDSDAGLPRTDSVQVLPETASVPSLDGHPTVDGRAVRVDRDSHDGQETVAGRLVRGAPRDVVDERERGRERDDGDGHVTHDASDDAQTRHARMVHDPRGRQRVAVSRTSTDEDDETRLAVNPLSEAELRAAIASERALRVAERAHDEPDARSDTVLAATSIARASMVHKRRPQRDGARAAPRLPRPAQPAQAGSIAVDRHGDDDDDEGATRIRHADEVFEELQVQEASVPGDTADGHTTRRRRKATPPPTEQVTAPKRRSVWRRLSQKQLRWLVIGAALVVILLIASWLGWRSGGDDIELPAGGSSKAGSARQPETQRLTPRARATSIGDPVPLLKRGRGPGSAATTGSGKASGGGSSGGGDNDNRDHRP